MKFYPLCYYGKMDIIKFIIEFFGSKKLVGKGFSTKTKDGKLLFLKIIAITFSILCKNNNT